jgi:hypothetical protein
MRSTMRRRLGIFLAVALLLLLGGDFMLWRHAVSELRARLEIWRAQRADEGWVVAHGATEAGGWPFRAALTINDLSVHGGTAFVPGGLSWSAERLVLGLTPLRPRTLQLSAEGTQKLRFGSGPAITGKADLALLDITTRDDGRIQDLNAEVVKLSAAFIPAPSGRGAMVAPVRYLTIGAARANGSLNSVPADGEAPVTLTVSAEAIGLPEGIRWPLGSRIATAAVEGTLQGTWPAGENLAARAAAWRDGGGSLEIQRFQLGWGPLALAAGATLALDDQLQPMGAGTSKLTGYAATLDALAANAVLTRSAVTAAKAVLSLMAGPAADGDPVEVEVPLTLQYRTLSMRQVPLLRLPEIDWPPP